MIKIHKEDGEIISISVNDELLKSNDGESWYLPKGIVGQLTIEELPDNLIFEICSHVEDSLIVIDSVPFSLKKIGTNKVYVEINDSGTRKYWNGKIGFKTYMEAKKTVLEDRAKEVGDVKLLCYEDDGAWIHLSYAFELEAEKVDLAIQLSEQIISEIEGAAEMHLGTTLWEPSSSDDEKEFTLYNVLPILRKLGFQNVKYYHGKREYGKDILFARFTEFQEIEYWGAQVKFGDISGSANGEIDKILGQIDDAFKMPFYDLYTKQKQRISKFAIIVSGKFTENAIEKICEKIENNALRNNIIFIDGDKIHTLAEKFRLKA